MGPAVFENEPRSSHQVANCFRHAGFTWVRCCRNPRRDVNRNAADLLPVQIKLANMDAATHRYPEWHERVANCHGAPNCPRRSVKNADNTVPTVSDFPAAKSLD